MRDSAEMKVPGGKLVRIKLDYEGNEITEIKITGDFFVHPEESVDELEKELAGSFEDVESKVKRFFVDNEVFGLDEKSMVEVIMRCRKIGDC
jgi:hypothetical protein